MMNSWPYRDDFIKNSLEPKLVYHNTRGLNLSQPNRNTKQIGDAVVNNHKCHKPVSTDELCVYELCCALIKSTANQYKPMSQWCAGMLKWCRKRLQKSLDRPTVVAKKVIGGLAWHCDQCHLAGNMPFYTLLLRCLTLASLVLNMLNKTINVRTEAMGVDSNTKQWTLANLKFYIICLLV